MLQSDKLLFEMQKPQTCHPERNEVESKDLERKGLGFVGKDMKTKQIDPSTRLRSLRMTRRVRCKLNNNLCGCLLAAAKQIPGLTHIATDPE